MWRFQVVAVLLVHAVAVTSASTDVVHLDLVPPQVIAPTDLVQDLFNRSWTDFYQHVYQQKLLIHSSQAFDDTSIGPLLASLPSTPAICFEFAAVDSLSSGIQLKHEGDTEKLEHENPCDGLQNALGAGKGAVIRFEDYNGDAFGNVDQLGLAFAAAFRSETTVHMYVAEQEGSRALHPHTDPYDVIVLQLEGEKEWTVCVPPQPEGEVVPSLNDAQLGQLQEVRTSRQQGCTRYEDAHLSGMTCKTFTLSAGDRMYMPKGIIHYAVSSESGSKHLTISIGRQGVAWSDVLLYAMRTTYNYGAESIHGATVESPLLGALKTSLEKDSAIHLLEVMPLHSLPDTCFHVLDTNYSSSSREQKNEFDMDQLVSSSVRTFSHIYTEVCTSAFVPHLQAALSLAFLTPMENPLAYSNPDTLAAALCSEETLIEALTALCTHGGTLPFDSTNKKHLKSPANNRAQTRSRRATCSNCLCRDGCDGNCNVFSCECDDNCQTVCNGGCTNCNSGCDSQVCNTGCTTSCDTPTCYSGCDDGCTGQVCNAGCDSGCSSCDANCNSGCDSSCDSSCDFLWASCDSSCDSSCDTGCTADCDVCTTSCDDGCYGVNCNTGCDDGCILNRDCDAGCNTGCVPTSCDENCSGPCNTDCSLVNCASGCDGCPDPSSCSTDCDDSCLCLAGFFGNADANDCQNCPANTFSSSNGADQCTDCASCSSGQYRVECGGASPGRCAQCQSCAAGTYLKGCGDSTPTDPGTCIACPPGTYQPSQGTTACLSCQKCPQGFALSGCGGRLAGTCTGIPCQDPPSVDHATVFASNGQVFPSTATYSCAPGYELDGTSSQLSCSTTGDWSGTVPKCKPIQCQDLSVINGVTTLTNGGLYPSQAKITCSEGYILSGSSTATCLVDGSWRDVGTCIGRLCSDLDDPTNGAVTTSNNNQYPSTATAVCDAGYQVTKGDALRSCVAATGGWNGSAPVCTGVPCPARTLATHAVVSPEQSVYNYPDTITYSCAPGYRVEGTAVQHCTQDGVWDAENPTCVGIPCNAIGGIAHGSFATTNNGLYPSSTTFACDSGYTLKGVRESSCTVTGGWDASLPFCQACAQDTFSNSSMLNCQACPPFSSTNGLSAQGQCQCDPGFEGDSMFACSACQENWVKPSWGNNACTQCEPGYVTEGLDRTTCIGGVCPPLVVEHGAAVYTNERQFPANATVSCQYGFYLNESAPSGTVACGTTATWEDPLPTCTSRCGDGIRVGEEQCDDGNLNGKDGCDETCRRDPTYSCTEPAKPCRLCAFVTQPTNLNVSCDAANETITQWIANHGGAKVLSSEHCGTPVIETSKIQTLATGDGCATYVYAFVAWFTTTDGTRFNDTATATVNIYDESRPTFIGLPTELQSTKECSQDLSPPSVTALDSCSDTILTFDETRLAGGCAFNYTLARLWQATDDCGSLVVAQRTLVVQDTTAPQFTSAPTDTSFECTRTSELQLEQWRNINGNGQASDACASLEVDWQAREMARVGNLCEMNVTTMFAVTDTCGNTATAQARTTIYDRTAPVPVSPLADYTTTCASGYMNPPLFAFDECHNTTTNFTAQLTTQPGACANNFTVTRTFYVSDPCGNTQQYSQLITVYDTVAPTFETPPVSLYLNCSADANAAQISRWLALHGNATVSDDCDSDVSALTWSHDYSDAKLPECGNPVVVTFSVTDRCGNTRTAKAAIVIFDQEAPSFDSLPPSSVSVSCDEAYTPPQLQASDLCTTPTVSMQRSTQPGACPAASTITIEWVAQDQCLNSNTRVQTVTVTDHKPPVFLSLAGSVQRECMGQDKDTRAFNKWLSRQGGALAEDTCSAVRWITAPSSKLSNSTPPTSIDVVPAAGCGATFSASVVFFAVDLCNNSAPTNASFLTYDNNDPEFLSPPPRDMNASCDAVPDAPVVLAQDMCEGNLVANLTETVFAGRCRNAYTLVREWVAVDGCNNGNAVRSHIKVDDNTPPVLDLEAQDLTLECDPETVMDSVQIWLSQHGGAKAHDSCGGKVTWQNNFDAVKAHLSDGCGATGDASVTFTAIDECGNSVSTTAAVVVRDTAKPSVTTLPQNASVECDGKGNLAELSAWLSSQAGAQAVDTCSSDLTWTYVTATTTVCGNALRHDAVFTVTDACNLTTNATASFSIYDSSPPLLVLAGENPQVSPFGVAWDDYGIAYAQDTCHGDLLDVLPYTLDTFPNVSAPGTYEVSYTVRDPCAQVQTIKRTVHVRDLFAPKIQVIGPSALWLRVGSTFADPGFTAADNFDGSGELVLSTLSIADGEITSEVEELPTRPGIKFLIYRAQDSAGNTKQTLGRTVTVLAEPDLDVLRYSLSFSVGLDKAFPAPTKPAIGHYALIVVSNDNLDTLDEQINDVLKQQVQVTVLRTASNYALVSLVGRAFDFDILELVKLAPGVLAVSPHVIEVTSAQQSFKFRECGMDGSLVLERLGVEPTSLDCNKCACAYTASSISSRPVQVPELRDQLQYFVEFTWQGSMQSSAWLDLKAVSDGVMILRSTVTETGGSFVVRQDPTHIAFLASHLVVDKVTPFTRSAFNLTVTLDATDLDLRMALLSANVVSSSITKHEPTADGTVVVSVTTTNDVLEPMCETLLLAGFVLGCSDFEIEPLATLSPPPYPFLYQVTMQNGIAVEGSKALLEMGGKIVNCTSTSTCIVALERRLTGSHNFTQVSTVSFVSDLTLQSEIKQNLESTIVSILDIPPFQLTSSAMFSRRRSQPMIDVEVSFSPPTPTQLIVPSNPAEQNPDTLTDDRYVLQFELSPAAPQHQRDRALNALNSAAIPTVSVDISGTLVTAIITKYIRDDKVARLGSRPEVVPGSVKPLALGQPVMYPEDIASAVRNLLENGHIAISAQGLSMQAVDIASSVQRVTSTIAPTRASRAERATVGLGVGMGILLVLVIAIVLILMSRRRKREDSVTLAAPQMAFQNPTYEASPGSHDAVGEYDTATFSPDTGRVDMTGVYDSFDGPPGGEERANEDGYYAFDGDGDFEDADAQQDERAEYLDVAAAGSDDADVGARMIVNDTYETLEADEDC
eukprot:m.113649 g.113649  ORF g.113649 m.113649 type:complete len:3045 (-) comp13522_c0_seq4:422-9556(-)